MRKSGTPRLVYAARLNYGGYNSRTESTTRVYLDARFLYDFVQRQAWAFRLVLVRDMGCTALRPERKPVA
jgi:hypothetical protein